VGSGQLWLDRYEALHPGGRRDAWLYINFNILEHLKTP
jgi:hypothetical protein